MREVDIAKVLLGIAVWIGVGVLAVTLAAQEVGTLPGLLGVLVAVLAAWAIGERMVHPEEAE